MGGIFRCVFLQLKMSEMCSIAVKNWSIKIHSNSKDMQFPTSNFQLPWVTWNLPTIENPGSGDCFFVPKDFPSKVQSKWIFRIQGSPINFDTMPEGNKSNPIASMYAIFTYIQFNFMVNVNAGKLHHNARKKTKTSSAKKNRDHDGVWTPIQGIAAWKITKIGYFPFQQSWQE